MPKPMSRTERVQRRRAKLRAAGLRPIQIWVPDTRAAGFAEECARQSRLIRESETGLSRAEDEAWELAATKTPDYASLHPGYKRSGYERPRSSRGTKRRSSGPV